jgi:hypothetical protein
MISSVPVRVRSNFFGRVRLYPRKVKRRLSANRGLSKNTLKPLGPGTRIGSKPAKPAVRLTKLLCTNKKKIYL